MAEPTPKSTTQPTSLATQSDWPGSFALLSAAFGSLRQNLPAVLTYIGVGAALGVAYLATGGSPFGKQQVSPEEMSVASGVVAIIGFVIALLLIPYSVKLALALADGQPATVGSLLKFSLKKAIPATILAILAVMAIVLGFVLLIVPGVILAAWLCFTMYSYIDGKTGVLASFSRSRQLAQGNFAKIWGYIAVSLLIFIAASLVAWIPVVGDAVIYYVSLALTVLAVYLYRWAEANEGQDASSVASTPTAPPAVQ